MAFRDEEDASLTDYSLRKSERTKKITGLFSAEKGMHVQRQSKCRARARAGVHRWRIETSRRVTETTAKTPRGVRGDFFLCTTSPISDFLDRRRRRRKATAHLCPTAKQRDGKGEGGGEEDTAAALTQYALAFPLFPSFLPFPFFVCGEADRSKTDPCSSSSCAKGTTFVTELHFLHTR